MICTCSASTSATSKPPSFVCFASAAATGAGRSSARHSAPASTGLFFSSSLHSPTGALMTPLIQRLIESERQMVGACFSKTGCAARDISPLMIYCLHIKGLQQD